MNDPTPSSQSPAPQPEPRLSARARRRRARRTFFPKDAEGRIALIAKLARRAYPSYDLFVYSLLCGAVLGLGYIIDSQGLLVFGILFAPLLTPWVGLTLATISGKSRLFFHTLASLFVSALLVFGTGALAGFASRIFQPLTLTQAFTHSRLWIPDLAVLTFGAILLTASFVRSEQKPFLPSIMVAYELFLPLSAGGFGLGNGSGNIWPHGVLVFLIHFSWATIFGLLTLAVLRFRPLSSGGTIFTLLVFIIVVGIVLWLGGAGIPRPTATVAQATSTTQLTAPTTASSETTSPTPTQPSSRTPILLKPTGASSTPPSATETATSAPLTLDITIPVTETRTNTPSPEPTPIYAVIRAREGGGAYIRNTPGGNVLATLDNGSIVKILPETQEHNGTLWIHIVASQNDIQVEGWIIQSVLETATPVPNWQPTETQSPIP